MVSTAKRVEKPRIGIFGIGLAAYWPQFESLPLGLMAVRFIRPSERLLLE